MAERLVLAQRAAGQVDGPAGRSNVSPCHWNTVRVPLWANSGSSAAAGSQLDRVPADLLDAVRIDPCAERLGQQLGAETDPNNGSSARKACFDPLRRRGPGTDIARPRRRSSGRRARPGPTPASSGNGRACRDTGRSSETRHRRGQGSLEGSPAFLRHVAENQNGRVSVSMSSRCTLVSGRLRIIRIIVAANRRPVPFSHLSPFVRLRARGAGACSVGEGWLSVHHGR